MTDDRPTTDTTDGPPDADQQLETTADHWRQTADDTPAEDSADEVARGADWAADQPGYGREGQ